MRKLLFTVTFTLLALATTIAQKKAALNNSAYFDTYIQQAIQQWKTPGISIVVVKDGNIVFKKGYGVAELGKPESFSTSTLSICASTTKAMTAACMGMLVGLGRARV